MTRFVQRFPWEGLAKRTLILEQDQLVIVSKKSGAEFTDDYRFSEIDPAVKTSRRGEPEWSTVIFGLVIASAALFLVTRAIQSSLVKLIVIAVEFFLILIAGFLFSLQFIKSDYADFYNADGDRFLSLKVTAKSKPFIAALRQKIAASGGGHAVRG
jgi:hypothetical protein